MLTILFLTVIQIISVKNAQVSCHYMEGRPIDDFCIADPTNKVVVYTDKSGKITKCNLPTERDCELAIFLARCHRDHCI